MGKQKVQDKILKDLARSCKNLAESRRSYPTPPAVTNRYTMAESNNPSIFVLGGLTLKKTLAYHVEDYQAFEKLYSLAKPGQGQKWIGAWKSDDTRLHHLVDDEWGTVVSFGCDFGFDSNYNKNDGS